MGGPQILMPCTFASGRLPPPLPRGFGRHLQVRSPSAAPAQASLLSPGFGSLDGTSFSAALKLSYFPLASQNQ